MSMQSVIEDKLMEGLTLKHLQVINESGNHNVPAGSESHFKVVLVADEFETQRLIQRHKRVNKILAIELAEHIHALAIHTYTQAEWQDKYQNLPLSPPCLGGSN